MFNYADYEMLILSLRDYEMVILSLRDNELLILSLPNFGGLKFTSNCVEDYEALLKMDTKIFLGYHTMTLTGKFMGWNRQNENRFHKPFP